jgi:5-methylcytosine-specific restriction enzyme A
MLGLYPRVKGRLYGTEAWRRRAKRQLELEPLCRICKAQGRLEPATVADHIVDHKGDLKAFWEGELQSLCTYHHNSKTRRDDAARKSGRPQYMRGCDVNGVPIDPTLPWRQGS